MLYVAYEFALVIIVCKQKKSLMFSCQELRIEWKITYGFTEELW